MNIFQQHPETVGETYLQHLQNALRFSIAMALGSMACLAHALLPFLFEKAGSRVIEQLHHDMVTHRTELNKETQAATP